MPGRMQGKGFKWLRHTEIQVISIQFSHFLVLFIGLDFLLF